MHKLGCLRWLLGAGPCNLGAFSARGLVHEHNHNLISSDVPQIRLVISSTMCFDLRWRTWVPMYLSHLAW